MPKKFRIATFNAENLFSRAKVLNLKDKTIGDSALLDIQALQKELAKDVYDKQAILNLYKQVKNYVKVSEERGKLWKKSGYAIVGVIPNGEKDWDGSLVFRRSRFNDLARQHTKRVISDAKAHILCLVEVENKDVLASFNSHMLNSRYKYNMLIDAFDPRGIDVALYSKFPLGGVWTHMFEKKGNRRIFSRDCLEVEIFLPNGKKLFVLCNHFKSKGYGKTSESNDKRKRQAERVAEIITQGYDLNKDWVAVAGDLNDTAESAPLQPLFQVPGIRDVLDMQFPNNAKKRWTYHYKKNEQIDFILVSKPLQKAFLKAGVKRRGIYNIETFSGGEEKAYETLERKSQEASDHGAVWAEFKL